MVVYVGILSVFNFKLDFFDATMRAAHFFDFMALIKCYECGKQISSLAEHCIHCGAPRKEENETDVKLTERQKEQISNIRSASTSRLTETSSISTSDGRVECSDCGKWISSELSECPYCGGQKQDKAITRDKPFTGNREKADEADFGDFGVIGDALANVNWKPLIAQIVALWVVSILAAFLLSWVVKGAMVIAVSNSIVMLSAFTLIHYSTKHHKLRHCVHIVIGTWLTSLINVAFGVPFINWLLSLFLTALLMVISIGISSLIKASR